MRRYFIGLLVTIGLIILLIVLITHGGGSNKSKVPASSASLVSYATTSATVRMTIDGPVNAPQNHSQVQVSIGKDSTTFEQLQGYNGNVTNSQSFGNTEASYNVFLHALQLAGFTNGNTTAALKDESGYCATGDRYIFELIQNGKDLERFWVTNCMNTPKTFTGNLMLNRNLFEAQVPNYSRLSNTADL